MKIHFKILTALFLALAFCMPTIAQEAKNSEEALRKSRTHDNVDPEYSQPMGQSSTAGTTDALLKVNDANEKQLQAYDAFYPALLHALVGQPLNEK